MAAHIRNCRLVDVWAAIRLFRLAILLGVPLNATAGSTPPHTDNYGDALPGGAIARFGSVRLRHGAPVRAVTFSPQRATLAAVSDDGLALLWDVTTGREIARLTDCS